MARVRKSSPHTSTKKQAAIHSPAAPSASQVDSESAIELNMEERIRMRAYEIFLARLGNDGSAEQDWLRAEAELRSHVAG